MKFRNSVFDIDPKYYEENAQKGKVERIDYHTTNWDGQPMDKYAFVYTPYGYDASKPYKILYLIHGALESAEKYLYQGGEENPLKRAVDNMIAWKEMEPVIIVTPTEYPFNTVWKAKEGETVRPRFIENFNNELCEDLIPAVETKYHTYAEYKVEQDDLIESRDFRNVMGWSMGSATTWTVFLTRLAYFHDFGFMSGPCSVVEGDLTKEWADETAQRIVNTVKEEGFGRKDFNIYAITGTLDIAFEKLTLQMGALLAYPELFEFYDEEKQNAVYLVWPEGEHHTQWRLQYTINVIRQFYQK